MASWFPLKFGRVLTSQTLNTFGFRQPTFSSPFHCKRNLAMEAAATVSAIENEPGGTRLRVLFPPLHPGMKNLDKSLFMKEISVPTLLISGVNLPIIIKSLKPFFLKLKKFKSVQEDSSLPDMKRVYLNPELVTDLPNFLSTLPLDSDNSTIFSATNELITFSYENWKWDEVLNSIIPNGVEKVGSFTMVGSLIHLNLREHLLPYKNIIGQVLLDNVHQARTVVNKLQTINTTYRNFEMEVIAGEPNTIVKVKESNIEFEFDFATVYWNSRLNAEHERIVKGYLRPGDILFDVCAGVGPFAIPAGKKKCFVYANDLNPESHKWLVHNVMKRKVNSYVKTFNQDGRDFIREHFPKLIIRSNPSALSTNFEKPIPSGKIHVTMNLPAFAVEFLNAFWGLVEDASQLDESMTVVIHVYCFIKGEVEEEFPNMALQLVHEHLRHELPSDKVLEVFFVRNVSPNKNMYRISFVLPMEILTNPLPSAAISTVEGISDDPASKRLKLDEIDD